MTYTYDNYIDVVDVILIKSFLKVGGVLIGVLGGVLVGLILGLILLVGFFEQSESQHIE
jgi:hypothetical protein